MFSSSLKAGLHISTRYLSLAILRKRWKAYQVEETRLHALPPGLVELSPAHPNIADMAEFQGHMQELLKPFKGLKQVCLSLPDLSMRAAIVSADARNLKKPELSQLLRIQMERQLLASFGDSRLAYQLISPQSQDYLTVAIQHQILEQFEWSVRSEGMEPVWANMATFQLYNLFSSCLLGHETHGHYMVLNLFDHYFTLLFILDGKIRFVRMKGLLFPGSEGEGNDSSQQDHREVFINRIVYELHNSLSFFGKSQDLSALSHLFIYGDHVSDLAKRLHDEYHLEVETLSPERLENLKGLTQIPPEEMFSLLPAVAASLEGAGALSLF